jgi:hypothetical protein
MWDCDIHNKEMKVKPHEVVRKEIESLYLQIAKIQIGAICIYPDLQRDLNEIHKAVAKLFDKTLTIGPDQIME